MSKPTVAIVVLHLKDKALTADCLQSLGALDKKRVNPQIVLVNNGTEEDFSGLKTNLPLTVIDNDINLGFAEGNNVGIRFAVKKKCDYVWVLNNDTIVKKDSLEKLVSFAETEKNGGVFGPKIYFAAGFEYHKERYGQNDAGRVIWWAGGSLDWKNVTTIHRGVDEMDLGQFDRPEPVGTITGTAMLVKTAVFSKIGLLNKKYFLYYEESDFCRRAANAGFDLWYVPEAVVWHKNAGSSGVGSALHDYYITRNRLYFGWRYAPWRSKIALVRQSIYLLFGGRYWQKRGIIDFYLNRLGRGSYRDKK